MALTKKVSRRFVSRNNKTKRVQYTKRTSGNKKTKGVNRTQRATRAKRAKRAKRARYGGDFNKKENAQIRKLLSQKTFLDGSRLSKKDILEVRKHLNKVAQTYAKPAMFAQLIDQIDLGDFQDSADFKKVMIHLPEEDNVETDSENDDDEDDFDLGVGIDDIIVGIDSDDEVD